MTRELPVLNARFPVKPLSCPNECQEPKRHELDLPGEHDGKSIALVASLSFTSIRNGPVCPIHASSCKIRYSAYVEISNRGIQHSYGRPLLGAQARPSDRKEDHAEPRQ